MTTPHSDLVSISFTDVVLVRQDRTLRNSYEVTRPGLAYGDWYVIENRGLDAIFDNPDSNFDVGHNPTGMKLWAGMTFWEAKRIAMAMSDGNIDASIDASDMISEDPDVFYIIEAIIASALMDHYVFPLSNYLVASETSP